MKIGILTGGGDVPGLNPAIKAVVNRAVRAGHQVLGIRRGWAGLLYYNPDNPADAAQWLEPLDRESVRTIDRFGGTHLHTSRANPSKVRPRDLPPFLEGRFDPGKNDAIDCTPHVLHVIERLGLDLLTPIGGDDTLSYAVRLHREGVRVVAIPKTMDNDVYGTDYCIGFSTAVTRSVELITALRTPTGSHERIAVIELFGRNSGETTLISSYLADTDRALIPEVPFDVQRLAELVMADKRANPSNYAVVAVAEGAVMQGGAIVESGEADPYGHRKLGGIGKLTGDALHEITGEGIVQQQLGYLMRAGAPDALDRMVGLSYGSLAIDCALSGRSGEMVALQKGVYTTVPLDYISQGVRRVDVAELYDSDCYRPRVQHLIGKPMFLY
jgi:ATP-dependent phosphofructokinase / diphosphate-dependent phosphofructokinase